jgi:hypothetical protein
VLNDDIFRFEVSMYDSVTVQKRDSFIDVGDNLKYLAFFENFSLLDELQKMARKATFHDQIKIFFVMEETIKFDDVRMVQIHLYFDFPY